MYLSKSKTIVVDGSPFSGAAAVAKKLAEKSSALLAADPISQLHGTKPFGLKFQLELLHARHRELRQNRGAVINYSLEKDELFAALSLGDAGYHRYTTIKDALDPLAPADLSVFLVCNETALHKRSRGKSRWKFSVLRDLAHSFAEFAFDYQENPCLVINTSRVENVESDETLEQIVEIIRRTKAGRHHVVLA